MVKEKKSTGIKSWPADDRPREKLLKKGVGALSNSESDIYIARFLSLEEARYVLREKSTFCLNSLWYYREIKQNDIKDEKELFLVTKDSEGELLNDFLVSCWTMLKGSRVESDDWCIFPSKNDIAIVSTVDKVDKFLKDKCGVFHEKNIFQDYKHGKVKYYSPLGSIKDREIYNAYYYKRDKFRNQREYRFVFGATNKVGIERIVFYGSKLNENGYYAPPSYIESIYLNSYQMNYQKFKQIETWAIEAGLLDRVKNLESIQLSLGRMQ